MPSRSWRRTSPLALALLVLAATAAPTGSPAAAAVPSSPGPAVVIEGSGWGHSVGMSQYGARAMAQQGSSAAQILQHYYPGTAVGVDARVPNDKQVQVDLYAKRPGLEGSQRVDLRPLHATSASSPASPLRVDMGDGVAREIPDEPDWWVSHDPAGGRYVLHRGPEERASGPGPVNVTPQADTVIKVLNLSSADSPYIGTFRWGVLSITGSGGALNPVLVQPMQNYLWGIAEVPGSWERGVLEAQAITARGYAGRIGGVLSATPAHQAYAGYHKELVGGAAWREAVDATSGVAVTYQGELAQTYYSSSHGQGRSEASEDSWAYGSAIPYLRSVPDPFSGAAGNGNPFNSWTAAASNVAFASVVGLARVSNVRILSRTAGGSPLELAVTGWAADGAKLTRTWRGDYPEGSGRGAGSRLRIALPLVEGGAGNGRIRSQQITAITLAPFTDDEDSVHQYNIGAVAATGITTGCRSAQEALYCPRDVVSRGQMATFLARALKLPADNGRDVFSDTATSTHRGSINALARAGKVGGYPDGSYRPDAPITREQMATFLAAAFDLPPDTGPDRFTDIADSFHRDRINAAAAKGVTGGCTASTYCPKDQVTREQMASFLARATGVGE